MMIGRRSRGPRVVELDGRRVRFFGRVNSYAYRQSAFCFHDCRKRGYDELILDFSSCEGAFLYGMLPLIATTDALRREGIGLSLVLPENYRLRRLFFNANWAHHLAPDRFEQHFGEHDRNVTVRRFTDSESRQTLVNEVREVALANAWMEPDAVEGLLWAVNEVTDNVLHHAECAEGGLVQVNTFERNRRAAVGVADSGQGILSSLREGHPHLRTAREAIQEALEAGTTRSPDRRPGNGLTGAMRIATMSGGKLEIASGSVQLVVTPSGANLHGGRGQPAFPGTFVYIELADDPDFYLSEALEISEDGEPPPSTEDHEDGSA